ncbi:hypothetical protein T310_3290 [Rasamsonia emersonii CBS 393.64]|uniref:Protein kinase domain-containing protein n=1 Tax=Rasamsonia emersonii (strain ATCC 16479 / CBS 393.64 / IMI 116815) TaxID=1408163 RepID=A0A0F4YXX3_RASE3|nr:hypothetical protein T310_3290 [Rasamsonia emersonii CBS 393.64]KKA22671.1 hypothetical protein T310_3290 [Rasamsonia emersonii CBS 393.64]
MYTSSSFPYLFAEVVALARSPSLFPLTYFQAEVHGSDDRETQSSSLHPSQDATVEVSTAPQFSTGRTRQGFARPLHCCGQRLTRLGAKRCGVIRQLLLPRLFVSPPLLVPAGSDRVMDLFADHFKLEVEIVTDRCTRQVSDPIPESEVQLVCQQLLEGLVQIHTIGILHRDLKPQNIFVVQKSPIWIKIGDFGVSKQVYGNEPPPKTRVGTDGYTAPEILDLLDVETSNVSAAGISFIKQLLAACPPQRPSAADALTDPWLKDLPDFYSNGNTDALSKSPVNGEALPSRMPKQGNLKTEMPFGSSPSHVLWKTTDVTKESGKIQFLLDHGFDIHSPGFDADKALLCVAPMDYEVTMFLLARGANIDAKLDNGETALRFAARHGNEDTLLGLLMEGADVNAKTENGTTPLHCAAMAGHMRVRDFKKNETEADYDLRYEYI